MKPYLFYQGLSKLAKELKGDENIYLGIRPYGFHAGNMVSIIIYPILLCEKLSEKGINPQFTFHLFLNDWEQDKLDGPDIKRYPFNIHPKNTTLQYTYLSRTKKTNVEYWQPIFRKQMQNIKSRYPKVKIKIIRNSSMKNTKEMKKYLLKTLNSGRKIASILEKYTKYPVLNKPIAYVIAVCPFCKKTKGHTNTFKQNRHLLISHYCTNCSKKITGKYEDFDYWFYHKPLAIPRLELFNIDLCITGGDHFNEGDYIVREKLIKFFGAKIKKYKTIYAPVVLGVNGEKMSKSNKNTAFIPFKKLFQYVKNHPELKQIDLKGLRP